MREEPVQNDRENSLNDTIGSNELGWAPIKRQLSTTQQIRVVIFPWRGILIYNQRFCKVFLKTSPWTAIK
jgi:hypothetical protein